MLNTTAVLVMLSADTGLIPAHFLKYLIENPAFELQILAFNTVESRVEIRSKHFQFRKMNKISKQ